MMTSPAASPLGWHNNPALKAEALAAMIAHREADELAQGMYVYFGNTGKFHGCFHGCLTADKLAVERGVPLIEVRGTIEGDACWHAESARIWGIPRALGRVFDYLFEMLEPDEAAQFAVDAVEAIPVGADLSAFATVEFSDLYIWFDHPAEHAAARLLDMLRAAPIPGGAG